MQYRDQLIKLYEGLVALIQKSDPSHKGMPDSIEDIYKEAYNDGMRSIKEAMKMDPRSALSRFKELQKSLEVLFHVEKAMVESIEASGGYPFSGPLASEEYTSPHQQKPQPSSENATPWNAKQSGGSFAQNEGALNQGNLDGAAYSVDNGGGTGGLPQGPKGDSFEMRKNEEDEGPIEDDPIWTEKVDLAGRVLGNHPAEKIRAKAPVNKNNETLNAPEPKHPADMERSRTQGIRTAKEERKEQARQLYARDRNQAGAIMFVDN